MIKVVYKKPNEKPMVIEVENVLEKFQELVGGYIEVIPVSDDHNILMILNEEGLLKDLNKNIQIGDSCIVGNIVFVQRGKEGGFFGLSDNMIKSIIKTLDNMN